MLLPSKPCPHPRNSSLPRKRYLNTLATKLGSPVITNPSLLSSLVTRSQKDIRCRTSSTTYPHVLANLQSESSKASLTTLVLKRTWSHIMCAATDDSAEVKREVEITGRFGSAVVDDRSGIFIIAGLSVCVELRF